MQQDNRKVLFSVKNLRKYFPIKKKAFQRRQYYVHANENISIDIYEGETLGLVGESGSGKSTFGRTLIQIYDQTEGSTLYYGSSLAEVNPHYVENDLKHLPKLYPEYTKAMGEYQELVKKREALDESNQDEVHDLEDKMMKERRHIQNDYYNIVRLAGGLLLDGNLDEISHLLLDEFHARAKLAQNEKELKTIDWKLTQKDFEKDTPKLKERAATLKQEQPALRKDAEEKTKLVEDRRAKLKHLDGFDHLEEQKDKGVDLSRLSTEEMRELRKDMQIIFQDPYSSLNTRLTLGNIIGEGVMAHNLFKSRKSEGYNEYIQSVMKQCGLDPYFIHRYPHQFSGGQRQRIGIARALALQPKFIVCDEAVSALDVSIQSQVINLLQDLKEKNRLTYLFITHDLSVVKYISDRIAVMYLGMFVELADSDALFANPLHPYTDALLAAIPRTDVESNSALAILEGDIPSAVNPPDGCRFHTRCRYCMDRCKEYEPEFKEVEPKHFVACHLMDKTPEERKQWMDECDGREKARLQKLEEESRAVNKEMEKEQA